MKKNVLITGASGNLGRSAVDGFLAKGYHVIAIVSPGKKSEIQLKDVSVYEADLTAEQPVEELIKQIITTHTTIDVAVLTVGGYAGGSVESTHGDAIHKMITLNFNTTYFVARPLFQQMISQSSGKIILIGSRPALVASAGKDALAYALGKSLIFKLAELLNAEAKGKNVVTSVIVPSTIDTPSNRSAMPQADFTKWVTTNEIVNAMLYLSSEEGSALREPVLKLYSNS